MYSKFIDFFISMRPHGVPRGGKKERKMSGFVAYILEGLDYDKIKIFHIQNLEIKQFV